MDRSLDLLIQVLQQTETLYGQLLQIIDEEKNAAISADAQRLTAAGIEKQSVISQLKPLDQQLAQTIHHIARSLQIARVDLNLATLAAHADPAEKTEILSLNQRLRSTIAKVHTANEECRQLIRHCLRLVQTKLGYFQHWTGTADVYAATGNLRGENAGRLLRGIV